MTKIRRNSLYKIAIIGVFFTTLLYVLPIEKVFASGTISGIVYLDYNMNGSMDTTGNAPNRAIDRAFGDGITVTVFDAAGVERGSATTTNGSYSISATGTGPYRVEFTNLPSGFNPSAKGAGNDGSVQVVPDGSSAGVNLAVISQKDYCQNNPKLLFNCYVYGNSFDTTDVLMGIPFEAGGDPFNDVYLYKFRKPSVFSTVISQSQIGPTWGLDYSSGAERAYAAAFFKKHTVFGPSGPGAIYLIDPSTSMVTSTFTVPGAVTNSHGTDATACVATSSVVRCDNGNIGWDAVGKTSLGGLALSDDGTDLYVMNLENRTLYELNAVTGVEQRHQSVPGVPNVSGSVADLSSVAVPGSVNETNIRPFAVTYDNDKIYIGLVTSAETTPAILTNLRAHVYEVDPTTFSFTLRFSLNLDYDRGNVVEIFGSPLSAEWNAWTTSYAAVGVLGDEVVYPQPWFTDITFDDSENMILGIRDRAGDQFGVDAPSDPPNFDFFSGISGGDTLKACGDFTSGWTIENNANCGGDIGGSPGNGEGVGGGEYYSEDRFQIKEEENRYEVSLGGLNHIPGYSEIASTVIEPAEMNESKNAGGIRWWDLSDADNQRTFLFYATQHDSTSTFGSAAGMGDIVAMCDAAPLQVGDRVWNDTNGDGIQDPNELPIANVDLNLSADTTGDGTADTIIGTAVTDANGNYTFGGVDNNNLTVASGCTESIFTETPIDELTDDAHEQTDNIVRLQWFETILGDNLNIDSNGVRFANVQIPNGATITEAYIQFTSNDSTGDSTDATTVTISVENQDDALTYEDVDNNISSRSYVAGSVSWTVPLWSDERESGTDQRTPSLNTLVQQIVNRSGWAEGNAMAFRLASTGVDRVDGEAADDLYRNAAKLVVRYNQACDYEMEPMNAYEIQIPSSNFDSGEALEDFAPTSVNVDTSSNGESRDANGIILSGDQVIARFTSGLNGRNEHNYDFGFVEDAGPNGGSTIFSLGNRLWFDIDNDGIIDPTEEGIAGASVTLVAPIGPPLREDGNAINGVGLKTVTTDANGYYRFDGLTESDYSVRIDASNFTSGGVLESYRNTTGINTGDVESQGATVNAENGETPANHIDVLSDGIESNVITLGPTEPTLELGIPTTGIFAGHGTFDAQSDLTVDFGFYNLSLSGTVWGDNSTAGDNNGLMDHGETGLIGYTVRLFDNTETEVTVGPDGILGTADDASGGVVTDASGVYNFQGLNPGDYRVVLSPSGAPSSSSGDANEETNPNLNGDNNDNGFPDNTGSFTDEIISGLVTLTPGSLGAESNNTVNNATGATVNPTVDFGLLLAPTQVRMDKLSAFYDGHNVVIEWNTGDEIDNLGFNVYRETNGQREDLNNALIAGSALKTAAKLNVKGENYRWIDRNSQYGSVYYVEDLDIDGNKTIHGPIYPKMNYGFTSFGQVSSQLISQISRLNLASKQKEFIGEIPVAGSGSFSDSSQTTLERQRDIASKKGVKIFVKEDGLYNIKLNELETAGFDITTDNNYWQLFVNSHEIPIDINDDSISFYGNALDSQLSDVSVYYLVQGSVAGMRVKNPILGESQNSTMFNYEVTTQVKDHSIYVPSLLNGDNSNWFGAVIYSTGDTIQDISVNNPYDGGKGLAHLKIKLQGLTAVDHLISIEFNDTNLGVVELDGRNNQEFEFELPMSALYSDVNQVRLRSTGAGNDVSLIDEISLRYSREYKAKNGKIRFSLPANEIVKVDGFTSDEIEVFELGKDGHIIAKVEVNTENTGDSYGFSITGSSNNQRFIAINRSEYSTQALDIGVNHSSNLSANFNRGKLVIITPATFSKEASTLAARREEQGWKTLVVQVDDIYDEYSFGVRSNHAIKAFLKDASTKWAIKAEYVLLFGDSSADHRNYLNQEFRDLIPTKFVETEFSETASDGWLADFDDDGIENLSIGRLPVGTRVEARSVLSKLSRYDQQEKRTEQTNLLVADNDFNGFNDHLEGLLPESVSAIRINRSQMSDPQMKSEIISNMEENPMVVTYTGHGSTGIWASPNVLNSDDTNSFDNEKLAFFMLMTCLNGYNHSPYTDSMAEKLIKAENGAIAVWASSGSTYAYGQILMSSQVTGELYNQVQKSVPIGDITRMTKHTTDDLDARRTWQLIGDPTVVIK